MHRRTKEILGTTKPPDHWLKEIQTLSAEDALEEIRKILDAESDPVDGVIRKPGEYTVDTSVRSIPISPEEKVIRISIALCCLRPDLLPAVLHETTNRMQLSYPLQKHPLNFNV